MERSSNCPNCGNNPVPHFLTWYQESLNVLLTPLRRLIFFNPISAKLSLSEHAKWKLVRFLKMLAILRFQEDVHACKVRRAQVLWEEAEKRGFKMKELLLFGKPFDTYVAIKPAERFREEAVIVFSGLPRPEHSGDRLMLDVLDDKAAFKEYMLAAGLPVAPGVCTRSLAKARTVFEVLKKPVIVKPRAGSRGRHSTTFVFTETDLVKAFRIAKQLCSWVVVEQQLFGPVYRATVINGKLVGVLRGDPPQVVGDGAHSISELVKTKNEREHGGVKNITMDSRAEFFLFRQNLFFSSVPEYGRVVDLSEKIGVNYGGSSSEDIEICHPDNRELFLKAAHVLKDPILGFDFIIPDITRPFTEQRCGFLEVNTLPFINLHHDPQKGPPQNVAAAVWDMIGM